MKEEKSQTRMKSVIVNLLYHRLKATCDLIAKILGGLPVVGPGSTIKPTSGRDRQFHSTRGHIPRIQTAMIHPSQIETAATCSPSPDTTMATTTLLQRHLPHSTHYQVHRFAIDLTLTLPPISTAHEYLLPILKLRL